MATWNTDNIVLTQKGSEILSKVQSGIGKITVSKIVSGAGYVSPSLLYKQTAVTNEKQTLTVVGVSSDENGSVVEATLTNASLTESYNLYQIGVYVTHQDYEGDVLYQIAQCNTDSPEQIPLPSVTPVTMSYSLYMEHSGTTNIAITVAPEGFLTIAMKDASGGVAGLDVNGKLSSPSVVPGSTVYYGSCATDLATTAKVATVSDTSFTLRSGVRLSIKFASGFCAETVNPNTITLNVNSLGAIAVTGFSTSSSIKTSASCVLSFIYDGTNFQLDGFEVDSATSAIPGVVKISDSITGTASDTALSQAAGAALKALSNTKLGFTTTALATLSAFVATLTGPVMCFAAFSDGPVTTPCSYVVYPEFSSGALTGKIYVEAFDVTKQVPYFLYKTSYASIAPTDWKKSESSSACYAACSTAAATAAKTVDVSDFTADKLVAGLLVNVYMANANTAASPTINISSTGAKAVYDARGAALTTTNAGLLSGLCMLVYDGTKFCLVYQMSTSTVFGEVLLSDSTSSTSNATSGIAATPAAVKAAFDAATAANTAAIQKSLATASDMVLVSSATSTWAVKTLAQFKTWLALVAANISDFAASVRGTVLTGLSTATNSAVSAADTVLSALGKLQAQVTNLGTTKQDKLTFDSTPIQSSLNPVTSGGTYSALEALTPADIGALCPTITVTAPTGSTVTAVRGATTLTATESSGTWVFNVPAYGTWTINATQGTHSASRTVVVDTVKQYSITLIPMDSTLNNNSWADIHSVSADGANYWSVGDRKAVTLSGTVGTQSISGTYYVFILGFNHNSSIEGNGIQFGGFKTALSGGSDICLVDSKYKSTSTDGGKYFNMNHSSNTNTGGWKGCDLRYDVLGSVNSKGTQNAAATTATNPVSNTLMAALPSDLRSVMQPMTKYSDNTGGGNDNAGYVTATVDYLPLLAEFEIFGARICANSAEKNYQVQYAYFANGNSKVKYKHNDTATTAFWWERSVDSSYTSSFCGVHMGGNANGYDAYYDYGVSPAFKV